MTGNKDLRSIREGLFISQQDAAVMLNVSRVTYIKWEQDPDTMPLGKYNQILEEFKRLKKLQDNEQE